MSDQIQNPEPEEKNTKEPIRLTIAQLRADLDAGFTRKELAKKYDTSEKQITNVVSLAGLVFTRTRPAIILVDERGNVIGTSLQSKADPNLTPAPQAEVEPEAAMPEAEPEPVPAPAMVPPAPIPFPEAPVAIPAAPRMKSFLQPTASAVDPSDPYGDQQVKATKKLREF